MVSSIAWVCVAVLDAQPAAEPPPPPPPPPRVFEAGGLFFFAPFDQRFGFPTTMGLEIGGGYHFVPDPKQRFMASTTATFGYAGFVRAPVSWDDPARDDYSVLRLLFQVRLGGGRDGRFGYLLMGAGGLYARRHEASEYMPRQSGGGLGSFGGGYQQKIGRRAFVGIEADFYVGRLHPEIVDDDAFGASRYAGIGLTALLGWIFGAESGRAQAQRSSTSAPPS